VLALAAHAALFAHAPRSCDSGWRRCRADVAADRRRGRGALLRARPGYAYAPF
jgi:hypothetical protein